MVVESQIDQQPKNLILALVVRKRLSGVGSEGDPSMESVRAWLRGEDFEWHMHEKACGGVRLWLRLIIKQIGQQLFEGDSHAIIG